MILKVKAMFNRQFKALMAVNLRLLNPQMTSKYRKKGLVGTKMTKKLLLQFVFNLLIFGVIYGFSMFTIDYSKMPGMFTSYILMFLILGISQSMFGIYNVFFAGKDLNSYAPLPFKQSEIFISKIVTVVLNIVPFTIPLVTILFLTGMRNGVTLPVNLVVSLISYLLVLTIVLLICAIIVLKLTQIKTVQKHPSMTMNALMMISLAAAMFGILSTNQASNASGDFIKIKFLLPLFYLSRDPLSSGGLITLLTLFVILIGLIFGVKAFVLPHLMDQVTQVSASFQRNTSRRKHHESHSIVKILNLYNRQLLHEPNLLLQVLVNSVMVPLIFVISFGFARIPADLPLKWVGVFFVGGIALAFFNTNQGTLIANLIALDRENFDFVKSLPISMKKYLRQKFLLGFVFQNVINLVLVVVIAIVTKMSFVMLISTILGSFLGTYLVGQYYFARDFRLRITNWTSITELFNRGGGNFEMVGIMFIIIIVSVIALVAYSMAIFKASNPMIINSLVAILILIVSFAVHLHYQKYFWKKFN